MTVPWHFTGRVTRRHTSSPCPKVNQEPKLASGHGPNGRCRQRKLACDAGSSGRRRCARSDAPCVYAEAPPRRVKARTRTVTSKVGRRSFPTSSKHLRAPSSPKERAQTENEPSTERPDNSLLPAYPCEPTRPGSAGLVETTDEDQTSFGRQLIGRMRESPSLSVTILRRTPGAERGPVPPSSALPETAFWERDASEIEPDGRSFADTGHGAGIAREILHDLDSFPFPWYSGSWVTNQELGDIIKAALADRPGLLRPSTSV